MRRVLRLALIAFCIAQTVAAQGIKLIPFKSDTAVRLRWIGNTNSSVTGWHVDRALDGGSYSRLTTQPLTRELSNARAVARLGRYKAGFYRMLFGVDSERDITQADITRTLTSEKVGFHLVMLASHPELAELTGEAFTDRSVPPGTRTAKYRVVSVSSGSEQVAAETSMLNLSSNDRVRVPDTVIVEGPDNAVRLRWPRVPEEANSGAVVAFRVWKGASEVGPFEEVTSTSMLTMFNSKVDERWYTWTDDYIDNGTTAFYYIRQVHATGELGYRSEIVKATAGATAPPPIPNNFRLDVLGETLQLTWHWSTVHPNYTVELVRQDVSRPANRLVRSLHPSDTSYLDARVETGAGYVYVLVVASATDTIHSDSISHYMADVVAPLAPSQVKAVSDTGRIRLSWTRSVDADVVGYRVHRTSAASLKNQLLLTPKPISDTVFVDTMSREAEGLHGYTITAEDRSGNSSRPSQMITARTIDVNPPVAPQITRFEREGKQLHIAWTPSASKDVKSYVIEHSDSVLSQTSQPSSSKSPTLSLTPTSATSATVIVGVAGKHTYRIRAVDSAGNMSEPSVDRILRVDAELLAPSGLAIEQKETALRLSWTAVAGADGYRVSRVDPRTGASVTCATLRKDELAWSDRVSPRDKSWKYEVAARNVTWTYGPPTTIIYEPRKQ